MKKTILLPLLFMATIATTAGQTPASQNPLLQDFNTPFGVPPFDKVRTSDYKPAFETAMAESRAAIDKIVNNPAAPTFENTIEALEYGSLKLGSVSAVFFNLLSAETNDDMQAIAMDLSPALTALENDISLNEKLFARVKSVYEKRNDLNLSVEQLKLLDNYYKSFVRNGADLSDADKQIYRTLTTELSTLSLQFGQNLLKATNGFMLHLTDKADLAGLPNMIVEAAASDAQSKGLEGWVITLHAPSYVPFLTYSERGDLREKLWRASNTKCFTGDENDNQQNIKRIVELRLKLANLLGYKTYADYVLEERMAKSADAVNSFLKELVTKTKPYAEKEVAEIEQYANSKGFSGKLMPWDWAFYSEKYKDEKYNLNDEMTRPYFKLENVEQGLFMLAERLYGLTFKENKSIPTYHPDVRAFEVYDGDRFVSVLYIDYFPREGKRGGAWMTGYRSQMMLDGKEVRPVVSLVCNFTKPTSTSPSLLSYSEVNTLLHEFGHGLHGMLAEGTYPSLTGTSVYRDFVELPSQLMENWLCEKEFLDMFAVHYQTGEKLPADIVDKIIESKNFLAGYSQMRQLSFGVGDMAWHSVSEPVSQSVGDFERASIAETQILPVIDGACMAPGFAHIFDGGYAAGYYSYKWAEVLEADAFELFKEKGVFSKEVAKSFRDNVLSRGGMEHPMALYVKFRGAEPSIDALLKKQGMN